jgi:hypothetical protein
MGIKFECPNGHKLNVKGFLAGKKAICPKCGARVIVPDVEDTGSSGTTIGVVASGSVPSAIVAAGQTGDPQPPSSATTALGQPPSGAAVDPIAEAPGAVWYVRPATGGQYGPASGEIMRGWIKEGRVGASSLVWRAGWEDWRPAESTFAELATVPGAAARLQPANGSAAAALPQGRVVESLPPAPSNAMPAEPLAGVSHLSRAALKRRRRNEVNLIASAILAVVTLILIIVLAFVWRSQNVGVEPYAQEAPAAK